MNFQLEFCLMHILFYCISIAHHSPHSRPEPVIFSEFMTLCSLRRNNFCCKSGHQGIFIFLHKAPDYYLQTPALPVIHLKKAIGFLIIGNFKIY